MKKTRVLHTTCSVQTQGMCGGRAGSGGPGACACRSLWLLCVLWIARAACGAAEDPFSVDCFFGWGGYYRPTEWMPVEISIATILKEPFGGALEVTVQQDEQNTLHIRRRFVVTPNLTTHLPLVAKMAYGAGTCTVQLADDRGRSQWRTQIDLWDFSAATRPATAVGPSDLLIGLVGKRGFGLLRLPQDTACVSAEAGDAPSGKVVVGDKLPNMVPWDWTGFVCLDLLILYDPDWALWKPDQIKAVTEWIAGGGKALTIVGPLGLPRAVTEQLSLDLYPTRQVDLPQSLRRRWDLPSDGPASVPCSPLAYRGRRAPVRQEVTDANERVFAVFPLGYGRMGVLGLDPASLGEEQAARAGPFWVDVIRAVLEDPLVLAAGRARTGGEEDRDPTRTICLADPNSQETDSTHQRQFNLLAVTRAQRATNEVLGYLQAIPQMRPLSIWPVLGLLVLLAILIGPVDYIVLKRWDRQPWTWVTCGFWIAAFTVGAYYGVQALRGGSLQLRVVSVLDGMSGSDRAWATTYSGLFAPRSRQYRFEDLAPGQWWSAVAPVGRQMVYGSGGLGTRDIFCEQHDGSNLPVALPVDVWTMQYVLTEQTTPEVPVHATAHRSGPDLRIDVTNRAGAALGYGFILAAGYRPASFGPVAPGATVSCPMAGDAKGPPDLLGDATSIGSVFAADSRLDVGPLFRAGDLAARTAGIQSCLGAGAAVVCVRLDGSPPPFRVEDPSCQYHHVRWVRLVVWPE